MVRREKPDAGVALDYEAAHAREVADLGFERPAVRPDVDEQRRVVLPGGRDDLETGTEQRSYLRRLEEFRDRARRPAGEIDCQADEHVPLPDPMGRSLLADDRPTQIGKDHGERAGDVGG